MMTTASDYLARLDAALREVPHGIAADIRAGIAEELSSLDPDAAEARIAQLGDPAVIAREAMDAGGYAPAATPASATPATVPTTSTRGFAIIAALSLSVGAFVVPVVGWFVGVALVLACGMWRTGEKVVAIVSPLVLFGILLLLSLPAYAVSGGVVVQEAGGTGSGPEASNPLVPTLFDTAHLLILLLVLVAIPASGLWLLWRMRGRTAP